MEEDGEKEEEEEASVWGHDAPSQCCMSLVTERDAAGGVLNIPYLRSLA